MYFISVPPSVRRRPTARIDTAAEKYLPSGMPLDAATAVDAVYRSDWGRIVATLIRIVGDFDLAEEAAQEAFAVAVEAWRAAGIPEFPRAWIIQTARRKAIDRIRRRRRFEAMIESYAASGFNRTVEDPDYGTSGIPHDRLRLTFTCCHPALAPEAQGSPRRSDPSGPPREDADGAAAAGGSGRAGRPHAAARFTTRGSPRRGGRSRRPREAGSATLGSAANRRGAAARRGGVSQRPRAVCAAGGDRGAAVSGAAARRHRLASNRQALRRPRAPGAVAHRVAEPRRRGRDGGGTSVCSCVDRCARRDR